MAEEPSKARRKELIKARWGILRNALLQNSQQSQQQSEHSIHRFSGYNLIQARPGISDSSVSENEWDIRRLEPLLTEFRWDAVLNDCPKPNIDNLEIAILALAACFPKGKCMRIMSAVDHNGASVNPSDSWLEVIKQRCQPCVRVWKVSEALEETTETNEGVSSTTMVTTLLVQESSSSTKYQTLFYDLDIQANSSDSESLNRANKETDGNASTTNSSRACHSHIIWTREPKETRLSLDDLVSHRKNNGVDNTGNICVWDSERTLAYLVFHHLDDFSAMRSWTNTNEEIRILELGTGMAGLSALALGSQLTMRRNGHCGEMKEDSRGKRTASERKKKSIHVTLTDGNPSGVKNNVVNQFLTNLNSQMMWEQKGKYSHYLDLNVNCETLLWTTDLDTEQDNIANQDIILVSDCVHFQNFHAALATTTLRCLRVGASAIFCQPTRGSSLDNFYNLLLTATSDDSEDSIETTSLLSCSWMSHSVIDQKHSEARLNFNNIYDENLHHPKLLVVTKLREISGEDQGRFIAFQSTYSPAKGKTSKEI